jgi:anti-sigma B factor antagonist
LDFYYHETDHDVLILSADGGLNSDTAEQFVTQLEHLVAGGINKVIVDCSKLDFISSYGVALLMRLHRRLAKQGGDVKLASIHSNVISLLRLLRLDTVLQIYPDTNRARLAFRPPDPPHSAS